MTTKSQCYFSQSGVKHIDYKDTELLKKFVDTHGKIISRRRGKVCAHHQRELARAIKRARFMGLLPYISR